MFAYDYPLLGVFWSMFVFFLWIAWIVILFRVIFDIFRSHDLGGFAKALWVIFVILVPFLGVFVYLIARGHSMADRDLRRPRPRSRRSRPTSSKPPPVVAAGLRRSCPSSPICRPRASSPTPSSNSRSPSCSPEPTARHSGEEAITG